MTLASLKQIAVVARKAQRGNSQRDNENTRRMWRFPSSRAAVIVARPARAATAERRRGTRAPEAQRSLQCRQVRLARDRADAPRSRVQARIARRFSIIIALRLAERELDNLHGDQHDGGDEIGAQHDHPDPFAQAQIRWRQSVERRHPPGGL